MPDRRDPRYPVELRVFCRSGGAYRSQLATNISRGGVFIQDLSFPVFSELALRLLLPQQQQAIEAQGRVVWTTQAARDRHGIGVQFLDLEDAQLAQLDAFLAQLSGTTPQA